MHRISLRINWFEGGKKKKKNQGNFWTHEPFFGFEGFLTRTLHKNADCSAKCSVKLQPGCEQTIWGDISGSHWRSG